MATPDPAVIAAVDLGSNTIKMTIGRCLPDGRLEEIASYSDTVRLGRDVDRTGHLADDRMDAALECLTRFSTAARNHGASRIIGVATEAVRAAANGKTFIDRVIAATGIEMEIIHGDREASLTFSGVAADHDLAGTLVIADIGGASTEVIVAVDGAITAAASVPVGSGRLSDRHIAADPPTHEELEQARHAARLAVGGHPQLHPLPSGDAIRLVLLGGTGEYLVALLPDEANLTPTSVDDTLEVLTRIPSDVLAERLDIQALRARVLPAGVAVAAALLDLIQPGACDVGRSGIRTGLLREACVAAW